jgi:hypothetical protein
MPLRKRVSYFGLRDLGYDIIDDSSTSPRFFRVTDFPDKFKAGKNLFKLIANPDTLVNNSEIYIEILDSNQSPIYYEPIRYVESDGRRVIAVYIYPDTAPGECTVYLAGRAKLDPVTGTTYSFSNQPGNQNYLQIPNVLWYRTLTVAPRDINDSEIIFTQQPRVTITEVVQAYNQPVNLTNVFTTVSASASNTVALTSGIAISSIEALQAVNESDNK